MASSLQAMPSRVLVVALLVLLAFAAPSGASAKVPRGFFGVAVDGPALTAGGGLGAQASAIRATGTRSVRAAAYWSDLEPEAGQLQLGSFDALVLDAARKGLSVLPVVHRTPSWAAARPNVGSSPPADPATYARFLARLVARYGPSGTLWREHPEVAKLSIRKWQIWNEPDLTTYWDDPNWAPGYVRLLKAARKALKKADPHSVVVAAGMTRKAWADLRKLYAAGGRNSFDVAAIHPYSREVGNVLEIVKRSRQVMRLAGDSRKPLLLSEISWSSGKGRSTTNYGWEFSEAGQATRVKAIVPLLAKNRLALGLDGVYWYTWMTDVPGGPNSFEYSGLRRLGTDGRPVDKPALAAWRKALKLLG